LNDAAAPEALSPELPEVLLAAHLARAFPAPLARRMAVELTIARAAFGRSRRLRLAGPAFAYTNESPLKLLVMAFPMLALGESLVMMAVLPRHTGVHVAIAALALYTFAWLLGVYRTMTARPHVLDAGVLRVYRGILGSAALPVSDIERVETVPEGDKIAMSRGVVRMDVGGRRVRLVLRTAMTCATYGGDKRATQVVVSVDEPEKLREAVRAAGG
jgi:hypothetical protein